MSYSIDESIVIQAEAVLHRSFDKISEPAGGRGYRVEHALRVKTYLTNFIENQEVSGQNINATALLVAGILHDIGDVKRIINGSIDYSVKIDHAQAGADLARTELTKFVDDQDLIEKIVAIIANHHHYGDEVDIETKLLQDADQLDELGYLNFWQMFQYSLSKGRNLTDTIKYWHGDGLLRKQKCVDTCNFAFTRVYAEKRLAKMVVFVDELSKEIELSD